MVAVKMIIAIVVVTLTMIISAGGWPSFKITDDPNDLWPIPELMAKDEVDKIGEYAKTPIMADGEKVGTLYKLSCPACGHHLKRADNFCGECGLDLKGGSDE